MGLDFIYLVLFLFIDYLFFCKHWVDDIDDAFIIMVKYIFLYDAQC